MKNDKIYPPVKTNKVLVIEDNHLVRKVVCQLLIHYGFTAEAAHNGISGITMAKNDDYDCIIIDFGLPDANGDHIARTIRTNEKEQNKPPCHMVVLSASVDKAQEQQCLEAGINQVFSKPLNAEIIEKIKEALLIKH